MFRCQACGEQSEAGEASVRIPVEIRDKVYPPRPKANGSTLLEPSRKDDPGGKGWEIAREAVVCVPCAEAADAS